MQEEKKDAENGERRNRGDKIVRYKWNEKERKKERKKEIQI